MKKNYSLVLIPVCLLKSLEKEEDFIGRYSKIRSGTDI